MEPKNSTPPRDRARIEPEHLSDEQRQQAGLLFLRLRNAFPQMMQRGSEGGDTLWRFTAETVLAGQFDATALATDGELASRDPEGLAFIARMDSIAREAVEQYRLPPGEQWDVERNPLHRAVAMEAYRRASEGGAK